VKNTDRSQSSRLGSPGFSVLELVVAMFILSLVLIAMLGLFDATNRVARAQTNIADTQQAVRIAHDEMVRMTRMAGRGWMYSRAPGAAWDPAGKVAVTNNVTSGTTVDGSGDADLAVVPGTDILRLFGVINGSLFEVTRPGGVFLSPALEIDAKSPSGIVQPIEQLGLAQDDVGAGGSFNVLTVDRLGGVAIVQASVSDLDDEGGTLTLAGVSVLIPIVLVGVLEEYAFYIRDNGGEPRLSMARFVPGSNLAYGGVAANLRQDVAHDIIDLQVALGIDRYLAGERIGDKAMAADEWYYDATADPGPVPVIGTEGDLFFVRINVLGRTAGRDFQHVAAPIARIEDHDYSEPDVPTGADAVERNHRRRLLTTTVDARNL
jgi:type II secretory pathway pseudopilin PulG